MSLLAYQSDRVFRPRPRPNQVDEWRVTALDWARTCQMSCRLTLGCGHQTPLAVSYPAGTTMAEQLAADVVARGKLNAAIKEHVDTHDCAAYIRLQAIAAVTARLKG